MSDEWSLADLADLRGCKVIAVNGAGVGELEEIIYDFASERPVWLGVAPAQGFALKTVLVPVAGSREQEGRLRVAFSADQIREQPPADIGRGFDSATDQRRLYEYFAVPFDESREVRVLGLDDDIPGQEVTL
ncbi:MAG TPA: PRC-barrel domain-containing protein [Dehalococcoidia bacterium]|jgi:hypothetical protein|nr:PRC-barrel domain-containing protein [Dehalococcoidia bacterium]